MFIFFRYTAQTKKYFLCTFFYETAKLFLKLTLRMDFELKLEQNPFIKMNYYNKLVVKI